MLVPTRRVRLSGVPTAELDVPVELAFFVARPDADVPHRRPRRRRARRPAHGHW
ncbi:MAG: hypothetical protein IRY90_20540 [Actinomadura rubrobrunea]|nr:hypothetical protein [Actinomadura rubrobrunea]